MLTLRQRLCWHKWDYKVAAHYYGPSEAMGHRVYRQCQRPRCRCKQYWFHFFRRWGWVMGPNDEECDRTIPAQSGGKEQA